MRSMTCGWFRHSIARSPPISDDDLRQSLPIRPCSMSARAATYCGIQRRVKSTFDDDLPRPRRLDHAPASSTAGRERLLDEDALRSRLDRADERVGMQEVRRRDVDEIGLFRRQHLGDSRVRLGARPAIPPSLQELVAQPGTMSQPATTSMPGIAASAAAWLYGTDVPSAGSDAGGGGSVAIQLRPMIAVR